MTKGQAAIIAMAREMSDRTGNLPSMSGIFPDYSAPIVRNENGQRVLDRARWGMPTSSKVQMDATKKRAQKLEAKGKQVDFKELLRLEPDKGVTNIPRGGVPPMSMFDPKRTLVPLLSDDRAQSH